METNLHTCIRNPRKIMVHIGKTKNIKIKSHNYSTKIAGFIFIDFFLFIESI